MTSHAEVPGPKDSLLRAALYTCVLPTILLSCLILGASLLSGGSEWHGVGFRLMLYFIVPPIFIATALLTVFVRNAPNRQRFAAGSVVALGLPTLITFGWLATGVV